jgi:putative molybdopterin biosynthesis protein
VGRRVETGNLENRVRVLRLAAGLSQTELANLSGVTRQAISAIESGGYVPNTAVSLRLGRALRCSVEDLFRIHDISPKISARLIDSNRSEASPASGPLNDQNDPSDAEIPRRVNLARVGDEFVASTLRGRDQFRAADGIGVVPANTPDRLDVDLLVEPDRLDHSVVVLGCDPSLGILADHVHRSSRDTRVLWHHAGSVSALRALRQGLAHVAGTHLWDPETGESNLPVIRKELAGMPVVVVALSMWQQGLVIGSGNPKQIRTVADLARPDVSIVNREPGSGSRVLFDHHLSEAGISGERVSGYDRLRFTHEAIAAAVSDGLADAGPTILAMARARDLEFVPLQEERYDLVIPAAFIDYRPVQELMQTLTGQTYRREIETLGGYDMQVAGNVVGELT